MATNPIADMFSARQWTPQDILARKKNLTGVPSPAAGDLDIVDQPLTEQDLTRKKKLMGPAMAGPQLTATQFLTGSGTGLPAGSVRSALGMAY